MNPQPLYSGKQVAPSYRLHYSWTGWPTRSSRLPSIDVESLLNALRPLWETDGLRVINHFWSPERVHVTFSTKPHVSPVKLAARAKGRLQHALRTLCRQSVPFSRKVSVRSVGENVRAQVESYVTQQVDNARFADARFEAEMQKFTVANRDVDLAQPVASARGRYWYNMHLVLVVAERFRFVDLEQLATIRDWSVRIVASKGYAVSRLSVMPDHLHIALRGAIEQSPLDIALAFQNNLAFALGQKRVWEENFYAGTFGEYDMWAIRRYPNAVDE